MSPVQLDFQEGRERQRSRPVSFDNSLGRTGRLLVLQITNPTLMLGSHHFDL
jgi:hypothetical protein